jgi:hypothetical protein
MAESTATPHSFVPVKLAWGEPIPGSKESGFAAVLPLFTLNKFLETL